MLKIFKNYPAQFGLSLFCLIIAFLPALPILGLWESQIAFHTFAPQDIWLNTVIHPRANIAGYEYSALDLSRFVSSIFGLSFFSLRLIPILCGLMSLFFFYKIIRRWGSETVCALVTALLAVNPMFMVFQHQLIIEIVDFFCILGVIYFYLEAELKDKAVIYFGIMSALTAIFYHAGRYIMLAFVAAWIIQNIDHKTVKDSLIKFLPKLKKFSISFILTLMILNPANIIRFFNIKFLIPEEGSSGSNEFAMGFSDFVNNLYVNIPLLFHSFLGTSPFYGLHSTDVVLSIPYRLITGPLLILAFIGIVVTIYERKQLKIILLLLLLTFFIPALSQVWPHLWTSLSPYRQFFGLIPIYIVIAFAINWVINGGPKNRGFVYLVYSIVVIGIILQSYDQLRENKRIDKFIQNTKCSFDPNRKYVCKITEKKFLDVKLAERSIFKDRQHYYSPYANGYRLLESKILPYKAYINEVVEKIRELPVEGKTLLINIPAHDFKHSQGHSGQYNYHQLYLALYLAESDIDVNYIVPYAGEKPSSAMEKLIGFLMSRLMVFQNPGSVRTSFYLKYPLYYRSGEYNGGELFWQRVKNSLNRKIPEKYQGNIRKLFDYFEISTGVDDIHWVTKSTKGWGRNTSNFLVTTEHEKQAVLKRIGNYIEIKL
jgi:hypothetical protein